MDKVSHSKDNDHTFGLFLFCRDVDFNECSVYSTVQRPDLLLNHTVVSKA